MEIKSVFKDNERIPKKYTCDGQNINPPLEFTNIPYGTKSLTIFVEGPDHPEKSRVHWVVWNIPPEKIQVSEKFSPISSMQGINGFGRNSYDGPCPQSGNHKYVFKAFALNTLLNLPSNSRKKDVEMAMQGHILDKTTLTGIYSREN